MGQEVVDHTQGGIFYISNRYSYHLMFCAAAGAKTAESVISNLKLHQAYDFLETMKNIVDEDSHRAKAILEAYPQLIPAFNEIQRRLGMVAAPQISEPKSVAVPQLSPADSAVGAPPSVYQQHLLQQVRFCA